MKKIFTKFLVLTSVLGNNTELPNQTAKIPHDIYNKNIGISFPQNRDEITSNGSGIINKTHLFNKNPENTTKNIRFE